MRRDHLLFLPVVVGVALLGLAGPTPAPLAAAAGAAPPRAEDLAPRVTIRRDTFGVPHILAQDEEAAAFGFGFAQAEDHGPEIARRYLIARGEAARWLGPSFAEGDLARKHLRVLDEARKALGEVSGDYRRWLRGFIAGVNAYMAQHRAALPEWVPTFTEADVLASGQGGGGILRPPPELVRKYPTTSAADGAAPQEMRAADDEASWTMGRGDAWREPRNGSNMLALAGSRTLSGRPILLANPHLNWFTRYWEAHITVPGRINFYGSTLIGLPILRAGFGDRVAYAQTDNFADLVDHYAIPLDPQKPDAYRFKGRTRPFRQDRVSVDVLRPDGTIDKVSQVFQSTEVGPVMHRTATHVFVARAADVPNRSYEGFYELLHARDLASFRRSLAKQFVPRSNFTYADADGNIQYVWNARLPQRPRTDVDYTLDVPGDDDRYFWRRVLPFAQLPQLLNPVGGYVHNANNSPWHTSLRAPLDPARYSPYVERRDLLLRAQVTLAEIEARERFSVDDVRRLKFNTRVLLADRVLPDLLEAVAQASDASEDLREGAAILRAWDRRTEAESRGAWLFTNFWDRYAANRPLPYREPWNEARPMDTPRGLADRAAALRVLQETVADLRKAHGRADVAWGEVHRFRMDGIDLPANGAWGAYGVYRVLTYDPAPDGRRIAGRTAPGDPMRGSGDAWVLIVEFTKVPTAQSVLAYGQTGDPASPHSRDQLELFARQQLRPVRFTEADIRQHCEREYRPGVPAAPTATR